MSPLVSILIPVYNAREWVGAAIESALAQTWSETEIVVLDDGSTDGSAAIVREFAGRVRIESQANGGQNVSRNRLTALSRGEWLIYLDADDELAADAVERKIEHAQHADAVYGTMELQRFRGRERIGSERFAAAAFVDPLAAAFLWKYPNTSSFMFRKTAVAAVGGWNEAIRSCTDYDLYFRLLLGDRPLCPAPASVSVYRHWRRSQASLEDTRRQMTTRLGVMWDAAAGIDRRGRWTEASRSAFTNAALGVIRILYQVDAVAASREFARLDAWSDGLRPAPGMFSAGYRAALRLVGFRGAERIAAVARGLRPAQLPVIRH